MRGCEDSRDVEDQVQATKELADESAEKSNETGATQEAVVPVPTCGWRGPSKSVLELRNALSIGTEGLDEALAIMFEITNGQALGKRG
jgi:hypothetical protein